MEPTTVWAISAILANGVYCAKVLQRVGSFVTIARVGTEDTCLGELGVDCFACQGDAIYEFSRQAEIELRWMRERSDRLESLLNEYCTESREAA